MVLCQLGGPKLIAGKRYKLELWMKGNESANQATVWMRTADKWQQVPDFGRTFTITTKWRKYRIFGKTDKNLIGNLGIFFKPQRAGVLWIDDVTLISMK